MNTRLFYQFIDVLLEAQSENVYKMQEERD